MTNHIRGDFLSRADNIPPTSESEAQIAAVAAYTAGVARARDAYAARMAYLETPPMHPNEMRAKKRAYDAARRIARKAQP